MVTGVGTATINFGAAPGNPTATLAITGQTAIAAGAFIEAWIQGDSTADHNAYEHLVIFARLVSLACGDLVAGTGFTIYAATELRITGQVSCRWVWSS